MRKNWLVTVAGIMAALGGVPLAVASSGITPPSWWAHVTFPFILIGIIGAALLGWAAKGQDEHSTTTETQAATIETAAKESAKK